MALPIPTDLHASPGIDSLRDQPAHHHDAREPVVAYRGQHSHHDAIRQRAAADGSHKGGCGPVVEIVCAEEAGSAF